MTRIMHMALGAFLLMLGAAPAFAVGDPPVRLNQREAARYYQSIRFLLGTDYGVCGEGQVPLSGLVTGGGHPMGGGQTIVVKFSKGATLKVVRTFQNPPAKRSVDVRISCA